MRRDYRRHSLVLQLLVVLLLCPPVLDAQTHQEDSRGSGPADVQPPGMFDLEAARRYESLSRWKEAEQEYLQAGKAGPPWIKQEALSAIERLNVHRSADYENLDFELGKMYEDNEEWKDAEQHYAAAAKDAPRPVRDRILLDLKRVRGHQRLAEFVEDFSRWLGYFAKALATALAVCYFPIWLCRIWKTRQGIQVMPFEGSSDDASKRIVFSLSSAREQLPSLLAPVLDTMEPNVFDSVPLIILPGVDNAFPDLAEDLEISGIKLPLAKWMPFVACPVVRVYGRWNVGETTGIAQARIQYRRNLAKYVDTQLVRSAVDSAATDLRDRQLALFAYDVLVKAIYLRRYGP
jgi:hypothetical protein